MKEQCSRKNKKGPEAEEDGGRRKQKGKSALGKIFLKSEKCLEVRIEVMAIMA